MYSVRMPNSVESFTISSTNSLTRGLLAGVWAAVSGRLVLGENVGQAAQFVQSGAADAGVIAKSLSVAPAMRNAGRSWDIPATAHPLITQGGLVLPWAVSREAALQFRDYLLGDEGRRVLASYGFGPPGR